jgi:hypothetical protein
MSPDTLGLLGLADVQPAPTDGAAPPADRFARLPMIVLAIAVVDLHLMLALFGLALLLSLVATRRTSAGAARLGESPLPSAALGVAVFLALIVAGAAMWHLHLRPGRGLLAVLTIFGVAAGYAVCGRALGERALPERGPLAQTMVGLAALVLPLAMPIGIPVMLVAAPLGLGAWLRGARRATS